MTNNDMEEIPTKKIFTHFRLGERKEITKDKKSIREIVEWCTPRKAAELSTTHVIEIKIHMEIDERYEDYELYSYCLYVLARPEIVEDALQYEEYFIDNKLLEVVIPEKYKFSGECNISEYISAYLNIEIIQEVIEIGNIPQNGKICDEEEFMAINWDRFFKIFVEKNIDDFIDKKRKKRSK